jgi:hypothetical protein
LITPTHRFLSSVISSVKPCKPPTTHHAHTTSLTKHKGKEEEKEKKRRGCAYELLEEADGVVVGVGEEVVQLLRLRKLLQVVQHMPADALSMCARRVSKKKKMKEKEKEKSV